GDDDITLFDNDKDKNNEIVANLKRIILLTNQLKLLLPKNESEYYELIKMLDKIIDNVFDFKLSENESNLLNDSVIEKTRVLLKKEWEVTKSLREIE
ncbi:hypothetical protein, partial [Providencia rustigianii]|uniref:hypothetical protein n=1 Tax=Providencia rustigianii TaxID=158850 RepID=UPI002240A211